MNLVLILFLKFYFSRVDIYINNYKIKEKIISVRERDRGVYFRENKEGVLICFLEL